MLLEFSTCTLIVDLHSVLLQTFACHLLVIILKLLTQMLDT